MLLTHKLEVILESRKQVFLVVSAPCQQQPPGSRRMSGSSGLAVAVIGAGAAGLCAARHLAAATKVLYCTAGAGTVHVLPAGVGPADCSGAEQEGGGYLGVHTRHWHRREWASQVL